EQSYLVGPVDLGEHHAYRLGSRGRDVLADVVGADRQLPVAPVDEDRELDRTRPAEVADRVQRRPHRTAGEQHVVHEDHQPVVEAAGRNLGAADRAGAPQPQVVAVERDVEHTGRDVDVLEGGYSGGETAGQRMATGRDAEQDGVPGATGFFQDLVRDTVD